MTARDAVDGIFATITAICVAFPLYIVACVTLHHVLQRLIDRWGL